MSLSTELNILTKFIQHFDTTITLDFLKQLNLHHETGEISIYDYDNTRILIIKKPKSKIWETHTNLQPFYDITSNRHFKKCLKIIEKYFKENDDARKLYIFAPASYLESISELFNFYPMPINTDNDELDLKLFVDTNKKISKDELRMILKKHKMKSINITNLTKKQMKLIVNQLND